jgi:hypothetical protein
MTSRKPGPFLAVIAVPAIFAITLLTFAWPAARLAPRELLFGLAGPASATQPVEQKLEQQGNAFELHRYADEQAARDAIENREIYGAAVASPSGLKVLTASAASPVVAGMIENAFSALQGEPRSGPEFVDVVPADSDDPRGSVLNSLVLPLVLSSVITALIVTMSGQVGLLQSSALFGAAILGGLVGTAMVQSWLGAFGGTWIVNAGVLCLTMLAITTTLAGLSALLGHVGLTLGGLTMVLVANPWSAISSAPELLPKPIGLIGQLMPVGAGGSLLRSTAFFDGAGEGGHLAVLFVWAALGLSVMWAGALVQRRRASARETLEPALPGAS